jgi:hypothetical protein
MNRTVPVYKATMNKDAVRDPALSTLPARSRNAPGTIKADNTEGVAAKDVAASFV